MWEGWGGGAESAVADEMRGVLTEEVHGGLVAPEPPQTPFMEAEEPVRAEASAPAAEGEWLGASTPGVVLRATTDETDGTPLAVARMQEVSLEDDDAVRGRQRVPGGWAASTPGEGADVAASASFLDGLGSFQSVFAGGEEGRDAPADEDDSGGRGAEEEWRAWDVPRSDAEGREAGADLGREGAGWAEADARESEPHAGRHGRQVEGGEDADAGRMVEEALSESFSALVSGTRKFWGALRGDEDAMNADRVANAIHFSAPTRPPAAVLFDGPETAAAPPSHEGRFLGHSGEATSTTFAAPPHDDPNSTAGWF